MEVTQEVLDLIRDDTQAPSEVVGPLRELVFRKCASDLIFFLETFWKVEEVGKGFGPFNLRDYQLSEAEVMQLVTNTTDQVREIRLKARQIGWTTLGGGLMFWSAFFHDHTPWLMASQTEDDAKKTMSLKIKQPMSQLPKWLRDRGPRQLSENQQEIEFDNGSWIMSIPATEGAGRGRSVFGVILDEFAFVEQAKAENLLAALDPLCYGPMFIFSTANGMGNTFHKLWVESTRGDSEWNRTSRVHRPDEPHHGTFIPWTAVPKRDQRWYETTKRKYRGREWAFYQEYPSTPEEAFAKTGRTALPMDLLRQQDIEQPEWRYDLGALRLDRATELHGGALIPRGEERDLELWVWEHPHIWRDERGAMIQKPNYVLGCDVAEGLDHGDRTSIVIMDANTSSVVAAFRGHIPVEDLGGYLEWLGYYYFTALIGVERNNHGLLPIDYLTRANYPRLYRMQSIGNPTAKRVRYGFHTNRATKPKMIHDFVGALRDDVISLTDTRLVEEAQTFVSDGKGGYGATSGSHDDHVLGHLIAWQMVLDSGAYPIVYHDPDAPLTFGDVFGLSFPEQQGGSPLEQGVGRSPSKDKEGSRILTSFFVPS